MRCLIAAFSLALFLPGLIPAQENPARTKIVWKKTVLDKSFRSEGAAVADVNKDGKPDVIVGDLWYEAPTWKKHVLRKDRSFDPKKYSESFAVFAEDINNDGYPDAIVIGFPGKSCHWYENPGKTVAADGTWKEHLINDNACNETPIYVDLLGTGKRVLVLGYKGEMCYFTPDQDVAKPWVRVSISGPGNHPGTHHFAHGLGAGDINGDGRLDVLTNGGWWEQPAQRTGQPWKFHPASFPNCADMFAFDVDGDGKNDILASSAHQTGLWWHQQKPGKDHPAFLTNLFFPLPASLAKEPADVNFNKEEKDLFAALAKIRADQKKVPWRASTNLVKLARGSEKIDTKTVVPGYAGKILLVVEGNSVEDLKGRLAKSLEENIKALPTLAHPGVEVGVSASQNRVRVVLGFSGQFALPGQTHALHFVDIDGDGQKDLVTGRRWWAHGPTGDDHPGDPAFLFWFQAVKGKDGITSFIPRQIDDDSGIGTQFAVEDINGDGLLDIIVSNKKGVFVFEQFRSPLILTPTGKN